MMREPEYTCPLIDGAIETVQGLFSGIPDHKSFSKFTMEEIEELYDAFENFNLDSFIQQMEDIRGANEELREWGNHWENEASELEDKVRELEDRVGDLEQQVKDLEQE